MVEPFVFPRIAGAGGGGRGAGAAPAVPRRPGELGAGFDVKLGTGGIRDVELVAQLLQLLHAGKRPELRERNTLRALHKLTLAGLVTDREQRVLADAYRFLRRVEHRLQLEHGSQTHSLPTDARPPPACWPAGWATPTPRRWRCTLERHRRGGQRRLGHPGRAGIGAAGGGDAPAGSGRPPASRSRATWPRPGFSDVRRQRRRAGARCRAGCPPPG